MKPCCLFAAVGLLLAGCFTVSETDFPVVAFRADPAVASNTTVSVRGFATTLTQFAYADGYQTIYYDNGPYGWGGWGGSGVAVAHTTTIVPQVRASDAFREQAQNRLEQLGFNVMAPTPEYVVEARFMGPVTTRGDTAASVAWTLCTLFTCCHGAQTWSAQLKIRDNRTGRLVFSRDYAQKYEVTGFSPIPLFGISSYDRNSDNYMQCWCLSALTEQMVVDVAERLTAK